MVAAIGEAVAKALADGGAQPTDLEAVGMGVPGAIDTEAGTVSSSPNLPGFQAAEPVPLGAMVAEALGGVPVRLDNDVRVAILGEWRRGAGHGYRNLLGVWVGTGVGGGLVLDGKVYQGQGAAGEIGHMIVKPGGRACSDGRRGHLEAYAGRGQMEVQARRLVKEGHKTDLFEIMAKRGRTRLSSGVWAVALEKKDKMARELVDDAVEALGVGLASVQNLLSLEAIVIGGGLADRLGPTFVDRIREEMRPLLFVPEQPPALLSSEFRDLSGAVGAGVLAGG
jgi:glucokinase